MRHRVQSSIGREGTNFAKLGEEPLKKQPLKTADL